ncbi:MAG: GHKL domain-containing protein [Gammaproteobacteria bacterium]|nr:GHKL domain-containing protein [Gammaproteobacteria bacterium]
MNSLERRLQLGLALSLVLLMGLLWAVGNHAIRGLTEDFVISRLEHDAEALLAALDFHPSGTQVQWQHVNPIYQQPFSGHYYLIRLADDTEISSRSLWDQTLSTPTLSPGTVERRHFSGPAGQQLLLWAKGFRKQDREFTLAVAENLTPVEKRMAVFQWTFAALSIAGLLSLLVVQRLVTRHAFRRLEPVCVDIRRLGRGETDHLSEDIPAEVLPLVQEFNRLLDLLGQRLERSRNALGNLAHALKGPLNLLVQYLDNREMNDHPELRTQMRTQTERLGLLTDRELKRARLAGGGSPGQRFDPHQELPPLVEVLTRVHRQHQLNIHTLVPLDATVFGDREDMLELLGNLLDNACKWAASEVRCGIITGSNTVQLTVEDDGPGCSEQELAQISQRGVRLDEMAEGHGLGLAIVKDIVKLYAGEMRFDHSPGLGGLRIAVVLPRGEAA